MTTEASPTRSKRRLPPQRPASKTILTGFRFSPRDLAEIDRRADERNMSRTQYVTDAALNRLEEPDYSLEQAVDALKRRIARLEQLAFGDG
jgi:hypothetical protein